MKALILALALLASTPAFAQVRPSVEVTASGDSFKDINPGLILGLGYEDLEGNLGVERINDRTVFSGTVTPSVKLIGATRLYANGGALLRDGDLGYRLGVGVKQGLTSNTYLRAGVRRDAYGNGDNETQGTIGFGVRF